MPYRRLPNTDAARLKALKTIIDNDDVYTVNNRAIDWASLSEARKCYEQLFVAYTYYNKNFSAQSQDSEKFLTLQHTARLYVSHFVQVLNMCVQRGEINAKNKELYGLEPDDFTVPELKTDAQLVEWGEKIIKGEKERLKKGGLPIYNPTIAKVSVHFEIYKEHYEQRKKLQDATAKSRGNMVTLREKADGIIQNIWNLIESYYAELPDIERYDKCRKMGVVYYHRKGEEHIF